VESGYLSTDKLEQLAALPGSLTVGGNTYVVLPPTPGDVLREALQMKQLARAVCVSPVEYAARHAHLPPPVFAIVMQEALKLGAGGGVEPNEEAFRERYAMLDGVRWRLCYHLSRSGHAFSESDAATLVTDANCIDICNAIDRALRMPEVDKKKPELATGTSG
jgi:hypothetical protein